MTRAERLADLVTREWPEEPPELHPDDRYLVIQDYEGPSCGVRPWMHLAATLDEAASYTVETLAEEYGYRTRSVVDLDTGDELVPSYAVTFHAATGHTRDEDCAVGEDGCCTGCGVAHGDPCGCGGRGFHRLGCQVQP